MSWMMLRAGCRRYRTLKNVSRKVGASTGTNMRELQLAARMRRGAGETVAMSNIVR